MGLTGPNGGMVAHDIVQATIHAEKKHGPLTLDPVRACAIMLREGGEAMNEALLLTRIKDSDITFGQPDVLRRKGRTKLYAELAQVAATAALIMHNLREEGI